MISANNLSKYFGTFCAVKDVSFEAQKGDVLGFLGPNGAGKSTTMRMLTGFITPSAGSASIGGFDVQSKPIQARKQLGYLPESAPAYADMTPTEFLRFSAEIHGFQGSTRDDKVEAVIKKCFLENVRHKTIENLSKGYRQRTCFAQAILHDPDVLVMDEPTDGLDPNQKKLVRDMIAEMAQDKAIILSTHVLEEVEAMCNRIVIINNGEKIRDTTPEENKNEVPSGKLQDVFYQLTTTADTRVEEDFSEQEFANEEVSS